MATYRNPWHTPGKPQYGPADYQCEASPLHYRGFAIYRQHAQHFDVTAESVCVGQYAGLGGAKQLVDLIHDAPSDYWGRRATRHLTTTPIDN